MLTHPCVTPAADLWQGGWRLWTIAPLVRPERLVLAVKIISGSETPQAEGRPEGNASGWRVRGRPSWPEQEGALPARALPIAGVSSTDQAIIEGDHLPNTVLPFWEEAAGRQP